MPLWGSGRGQRPELSQPLCQHACAGRGCVQVLSGAGEINLLRDALQALDDLFLVVVVGEFNSGKRMRRSGSTAASC